MLKQVVLGRHMMLQVECILHCTSPENGIQTAQYADRYTGQPMHPRCQSVQYLPANQNSDTSMEVVSWVVLVLHLSGAGQSELPWGMLLAVLDVIIPDNSASAGALSTDGNGVGEVVFPPLAMGLSVSPCFMLELMGSR